MGWYNSCVQKYTQTVEEKLVKFVEETLEYQEKIQTQLFDSLHEIKVLKDANNKMKQFIKNINQNDEYEKAINDR